MTKKRLWITRRLSDATLERAARDYDVVINHDDQPGTAEQLIAASAEFDAIIPCHSEHFSADVVAQFLNRLKIVANHSVGVDHCNLPALKGRSIAVTNTPDVLSDATAELAMLLCWGQRVTLLRVIEPCVQEYGTVGRPRLWSASKSRVRGWVSSAWAAWVVRSQRKRVGLT